MPKTATKHIPKQPKPVGSVKDGKLKVRDGDTGKISWRSGKKGFAKDYDGEPISKQYGRADLKNRPHHQPKMGGKRKGHQPRMGSKPQHEPK